MSALSSGLRRELEGAVVAGRGVAEEGVRAALSTLGVFTKPKPQHLSDDQARLRRGLRAKLRQLGGDHEVLVWDAAYEQWHRLLFARFLAERGLLRHPTYNARVTLADCDELAGELGEPDGWSVAGRFAAEILPGIFRLDDPCVQLRLAPEHRQRLQQIVTGLPAEVFAADDSLGWVYQYWQSKRKDEVNASEVKIGGADLGPVTQLFTENYMVRFLLENSLGAWWAAHHPDSPLLDGFEFLRFDDDTGLPAAGTFDEWPDTVAQVTVMDPCCGSGHFLVEAFKMLWQMRAEEEDLDPVAAQDAVLADNLFGLELDPRCVQIAMFAVALQAWTDGGGWRQLPTPNIACSGIPAKAPLEEWTALADGDPRLETALAKLHGLFKDADTLGSLIDPRRATQGSDSQRSFDDVDFDEVAPLLQQAAERETDDPATAVLGADAAGIARAAQLLTHTYTLIATNVPYLGRHGQSELLREFLESHWPNARWDLAAAMTRRFLRANGSSSTSCLVLPQAFLATNRYESFRKRLLVSSTIRCYAKLGDGAFSSIGGAVVNVGLMIAAEASPAPDHGIVYLDAVDSQSKRDVLRAANLGRVPQASQLDHPGSRITLEAPSEHPYLGECVDTHQGIATSDGARFVQKLWEVQLPRSGWHFLQSAPAKQSEYAGREDIIFWGRMGDGKITEVCQPGATFRGQAAWDRQGVVVAQMSSLHGTLYTGERFDGSAVVLTPNRPEDRPAMWAYVQSGSFEASVRSIDSKLRVSNATMASVPFDVERWRKVAEEEYPDGLPQPWSDDPTQWLFEGHPAVATEPLQVAVARLVSYRWPEQPDNDGLDHHADDDGIVCLPAVAGEQPAADRLQALLADAFGDQWGPGSIPQLLEQADSSKKTLADWLEGDFFKHHCAVFSNRPFVWHITDGTTGGFSALVNYHKLDRAGLEKLTYTYLGDWIERQTADAADDVPGADSRLAAAKDLKEQLELILDGEPPYDIYVRWKALHEQPIGWDPDLDDGVRLNIRPFMTADILAGPKSVPHIHWKKDRGKNPDGTLRHNDKHHTNHQKRTAREKVGQ